MRVNYSNISGYYEGDVRGSNIPPGFGTQFFNNGNRYEGFFLEGKRRGYGEALIGKRLIYRGEWVDDKRHGCGYARYDGLEYDCEYIGYFVKDHPTASASAFLITETFMWESGTTDRGTAKEHIYISFY